MNEHRVNSHEEAEYAQQKIQPYVEKGLVQSENDLSDLTAIYQQYIDLHRQNIDPDIPQQLKSTCQTDLLDEFEQEHSGRQFLNGLSTLLIGGGISTGGTLNMIRVYNNIEAQVDAQFPPQPAEQIQAANKTTESFKDQIEEAGQNGTLSELANQVDQPKIVDAYITKNHETNRQKLHTQLADENAGQILLSFGGAVGGGLASIVGVGFAVAGASGFFKWRSKRIALNKKLANKT